MRLLLWHLIIVMAFSSSLLTAVSYFIFYDDMIDTFSKSTSISQLSSETDKPYYKILLVSGLVTVVFNIQLWFLFYPSIKGVGRNNAKIWLMLSFLIMNVGLAMLSVCPTALNKDPNIVVRAHQAGAIIYFITGTFNVYWVSINKSNNIFTVFSCELPLWLTAFIPGICFIIFMILSKGFHTMLGILFEGIGVMSIEWCLLLIMMVELHYDDKTGSGFRILNDDDIEFVKKPKIHNCTNKVWKYGDDDSDIIDPTHSEDTKRIKEDKINSTVSIIYDNEIYVLANPVNKKKFFRDLPRVFPAIINNNEDYKRLVD